mmetsp:Transcript_31167/g.85395  ORF Transcript_31167/g.85395 Transcript_31167/m.85395 type:complete len:279 (+) Transcript_31167:2675-3511(+)
MRWLHHRLQRRQLHDVVKGCQAQQRNRAVSAPWRFGRAPGALHKVAEKRPLHVLKEGRTLLVRVHLRERLSLQRRPGRDGFPLIANAVAETGGAISVKAQQPVHREKGADRPLILRVSGHGRRGLLVHVYEKELQLRETRDGVVEKLSQTIIGVSYALGHLLYPVQVCDLSGHGLRERSVRGLRSPGHLLLHHAVQARRRRGEVPRGGRRRDVLRNRDWCAPRRRLCHLRRFSGLLRVGWVLCGASFRRHAGALGAAKTCIRRGGCMFGMATVRGTCC